jgi:hypothetical protein
MSESMTFPRTRQGVRDLDRVRAEPLPISGRPAPAPSAGVNVGSAERFLASVSGGALTVFGLARGDLFGFGMALLGGALLYRGVTGHCPCYQALGLSTAGNTGGPAEAVYRRA